MSDGTATVIGGSRGTIRFSQGRTGRWMALERGIAQRSSLRSLNVRARIDDLCRRVRRKIGDAARRMPGRPRPGVFSLVSSSMRRVSEEWFQPAATPQSGYRPMLEARLGPALCDGRVRLAIAIANTLGEGRAAPALRTSSGRSGGWPRSVLGGSGPPCVRLGAAEKPAACSRSPASISRICTTDGLSVPMGRLNRLLVQGRHLHTPDRQELADWPRTGGLTGATRQGVVRDTAASSGRFDADARERPVSLAARAAASAGTNLGSPRSASRRWSSRARVRWSADRGDR